MELLTVEHRPASPQEVDELRLTEDQSVHHLRYRFLADGLPVMIGVYILPEAILKSFDAEHDLKQPLVNFVAQFSHHRLENGHVQFDAVAASPVLAADLNIEPGTPLLDVHGTVYASENMPIFLMHEYYRQGEGLRFRFTHP